MAASIQVIPQTSDGAMRVHSTGLRTVARQWFTTTGVDTGPREMAVNGSVTPQLFFAGPPPGVRWGVALIIMAISDNNTFNQADFGGIVGGLTNGLQLLIRRAGDDVDIFGGFVVRRNYDWISLPTNVQLTNWAGSEQTLSARFHIFGDAGEHAILDGDKQESFAVRVRDDLTSLVAFRTLCRYVALE